MEEMNKLIRKTAFTSGLIVAVIGVVITIGVIYLMGGTSSMMGVVGIGVGTFVVAIVIDVVLALDMRKKIGGFWSFKQAVTGIFIMLIVGYIFQQAVTIVFANVIDPAAKTRMIDNVNGLTETMMSNQGIDQAKIDEKIAESREKMEGSYSLAPAKLGKGIGIAIIFCFILALILGAILKKEPPVFAASEVTEE